MFKKEDHSSEERVMPTLTGLSGMFLQMSLSSNTVAHGHKEAKQKRPQTLLLGVHGVAPLGSAQI